MKYDFDVPVDQTSITTMKWEEKFRNGKDLVCMSLADSDFHAPPILVKRLEERVRKAHFGYTYRDDSFYASITNWYKRHFGYAILKEWICKGAGIYPSICLIIQEFTAPGDGIIYTTPVHEVFRTVIESNGRVPVESPLILDKKNRYTFDYDDFEKKVCSQNIKIFILCSPHNPVCRVWTGYELERIAEICLKNNVLVVSDEVYSPLVHPNINFTPFGSLSKEIERNTITCFSPSKAFSLTGMKDSVTIISDEEKRARYKKALVRMNMNFGENLFGTVAIKCVLDECDDWLNQQLDYVMKNREYLQQSLKDAGVPFVLMPSEATVFAWLDCRTLGFSDDELDHFFSNQAKVSVRVGGKMGEGGTGFVRFVLACPRSTLEKAVNRIIAAYKKLE